ncbi:MAG TPA: tetratricopeptide repeat protein, partial [Myxococcota bacterium]
MPGCAGVLLGVLGLTSGCAHLPGFGRESSLEAYQQKMLEQRAAMSQVAQESEEGATLESRVESGDALAEKGQPDRAMLKYLEAVRLDPDATLPRERIAYLQLTRDLERAEAIFGQLLLKDPTNASALRGVGLARLGQGDLAGAQAALERALDLEPESVSAHYALGAVLDLEGDHARALVHNQRARALRPEDAALANGVGVSWLMLGRLPQAETAFRDAIRLDPDVPTYRNNLGLA